MVAAPFARWVPLLEIVNDARPYAVVGSGLALLASVLVGDCYLVQINGVLLGAIVLLFLVPLVSAAGRGIGTPAVMKVVTFNVKVGNRRYGEIAGFLESADADVILLQEVDRCMIAQISPVARTIFNTVHFGGWDKGESCIALLCRHSCLEVESIDRTTSNPGLVRARVDWDGSAVEFIGIHVAYPFDHAEQVRHMDWLSGYTRPRQGPLVVAGDFNLTPFSTKLMIFAFRTGLRRHTNWLLSWPADRLRRAFLIDHVFSTREFSTVAAVTGPFLGSDHIPIIVNLGLTPLSRKRHRR